MLSKKEESLDEENINNISTSSLNTSSLTPKFKIEPKRIRFVYSNEDSLSNQVLVEGVYNAKSDGLKILKPLYTHAKYEYNKSEIKDIYNGNVKE